MFQGSLDPKIRFLGQKVCCVARLRTDRHTDTHESENRGHPFRVSGIFPSTYHQGSVQYKAKYPLFVWNLSSLIGFYCRSRIRIRCGRLTCHHSSFYFPSIYHFPLSSDFTRSTNQSLLITTYDVLWMFVDIRTGNQNGHEFVKTAVLLCSRILHIMSILKLIFLSGYQQW